MQNLAAWRSMVYSQETGMFGTQSALMETETEDKVTEVGRDCEN